MPNVFLHLGDAVKWAREYSGESFHAIFCDAPYHLTSIVKRYSKSGPSEANLKLAPGQGNSPYERGARGFMGKQWDGGDLAFNPETWEAFGNILHSGAFGMAFASSRGWHRMAVAIEDAGFIIHPTIFGFCYGSGFPKATRVKDNTVFSGHRYGLQALKPALEPIIVFQKPYNGRPIDNITETGAGVLNVDGGRIVFQGDDKPYSYPNGSGGSHGAVPIRINYTNPVEGNPQGRWPANFYLGDTEAARRLDEQSGYSVSTIGSPRGTTKKGMFANSEFNKVGTEHNDSGGASRFFFRVSEQIDDADPVRYVAKASRRERDAGLNGMPTVKMGMSNGAQVHGEGYSKGQEIGLNRVIERHNPHPTVKPLSLTKYLATLLLPPAEYAPRRLFVPFAGVASECIGAMQAGWDEVVGVEITEEYLPIAQARIDYWKEKEYA